MHHFMLHRARGDAIVSVKADHAALDRNGMTGAWSIDLNR